MTFGERLKHKRERKELSQCEVAKKLGTSNEKVFRWEHDMVLPSLINLISLADVFQCSLDELVGRNCERL